LGYKPAGNNAHLCHLVGEDPLYVNNLQYWWLKNTYL